MKAILKLLTFIAFAIIFQACKNEDLKTVTTTTTDNYNIVVLSDKGSIKNGKGKFYLEFQNATKNQPVKVGNVGVQANMPMPGMPMVNDAEVSNTDKPGRYAVKYDLSMIGNWTLNVRFDDNKSVTLPITVN
jgi:hypothetical protein